MDYISRSKDFDWIRVWILAIGLGLKGGPYHYYRNFSFTELQRKRILKSSKLGFSPRRSLLNKLVIISSSCSSLHCSPFSFLSSFGTFLRFLGKTALGSFCSLFESLPLLNLSSSFLFSYDMTSSESENHVVSHISRLQDSQKSS